MLSCIKVINKYDVRECNFFYFILFKEIFLRRNVVGSNFLLFDI